MSKPKKNMKKKKDWQTKAAKRKYKEQDEGILGIMFIVRDFFKNLTDWIEEMEEQFNAAACIRTLGIPSGNEELEEMPHSDSLNNYLKKLSPQCLAELRKK